MPILFVHGVATRWENGFNETWPRIEGNLRKFVAPEISENPENVRIERLYWGDLAAPLTDERYSLPDSKTINRHYRKKGTWLVRKFKEFSESDKKWESAKDIGRRAPKKAWHMFGHWFSRRLHFQREAVNETVTLFFGDVFYYLARRGNAEDIGEINKALLSKLRELHDSREENDEPLIVFSHSMGGQLIYDAITHYLPNSLEESGYQNIHIDFWVATASQVGLFKEMKVFKNDEGKSNESNRSLEAIAFPPRHLGIWWNLWDPADYLSFTVKPFVNDVFDDMYDSVSPTIKAHTAYFEDSDFYEELASYIQEAIQVRWDRKQFMEGKG